MFTKKSFFIEEERKNKDNKNIKIIKNDRSVSKNLKQKENIIEKDVQVYDKVNIISWNSAGVLNKSEGFWCKMWNYDIIILIETWIQNVKGIETSLNKDYNWFHKAAVKEKKKEELKEEY